MYTNYIANAPLMKHIANRMKIKLQEYLKRHGYATSNKEARRLIRDQIVTFNGVPLKSCSAMVSSEKTSSIQVSWIIIQDDDNTASGNSSKGPSPQSTHHDDMPSCCIAYNKPCGMICTNFPTETKLCLNDIDPSLPGEHYHAVGRLDQHSHGLLLFSSDGRLTSRLLSPSSAIERVYQIIVRGDVGSVQQGRYEEICTSVEKGIDTDYGCFKGRIISMERNVGFNYEHLKCGEDCGGKRKDVFDDDDDDDDGPNKEITNEGYSGKKTKEREREEGNCSETSSILSLVVVAVKEGKKRMVRRLFAAMGLFVLGR